MNSLDILCFTSVARTRSFSIAARELLISQQAVSRHIKVLEDELGFPLFFRNFQNVQLTEAGELMLRYYLERDSYIAAFQKKLARARADGVLRIGCSQWLGRPQWFSRLLVRFAERYPGASAFVHDLTADETRSSMKNGEMDVLFTTNYASRFLPVTWEVRRLGEERLHLLSGRRSDPEAALAFCGETAGEPDDESVRIRVRTRCAELGLRAGGVEVLPEMGSVLLHILLRGGSAFTVGRPTIAANPQFTLLPLERTATSVVCAPYQSAKDSVRALLQLLDEEGVS